MNKQYFSNKNNTFVLYFFLHSLFSNNQHWGAVKEGLKNSQIQDFLYSVDKFVGTLSSARQNLEDKIQLQKVDIESYLNNLHNPSDYITAGQ